MFISLMEDAVSHIGHTGYVPKKRSNISMQVKTLDVIKQRLVNLNENEELSIEGNTDGSIAILSKNGITLMVITSDMAVSLSKALMAVRKKVVKLKEKTNV